MDHVFFGSGPRPSDPQPDLEVSRNITFATGPRDGNPLDVAPVPVPKAWEGAESAPKPKKAKKK